MLINVSPDARTFHLRSRFFSYILTVMENGQIENLIEIGRASCRERV